MSDVSLFLVHLLTTLSRHYALGMCLSAGPAPAHSLAQQPNEEGAGLQIRNLRTYKGNNLPKVTIKLNINPRSLKLTTTLGKAAFVLGPLSAWVQNLIPPHSSWMTLGEPLNNLSKPVFS